MCVLFTLEVSLLCAHASLSLSAPGLFVFVSGFSYWILFLMFSFVLCRILCMYSAYLSRVETLVNGAIWKHTTGYSQSFQRQVKSPHVVFRFQPTSVFIKPGKCSVYNNKENERWKYRHDEKWKARSCFQHISLFIQRFIPTICG